MISAHDSVISFWIVSDMSITLCNLGLMLRGNVRYAEKSNVFSSSNMYTYIEKRIYEAISTKQGSFVFYGNCNVHDSLNHNVLFDL